MCLAKLSERRQYTSLFTLDADEDCSEYSSGQQKFTFRIRTTVVIRYEFHRSQYRSVFTLFEFRFVKTDIYRTFNVSFCVHYSLDDIHIIAKYNRFNV